jgi:hypothetical protein
MPSASRPLPEDELRAEYRVTRLTKPGRFDQFAHFLRNKPKQKQKGGHFAGLSEALRIGGN